MLSRKTLLWGLVALVVVAGVGYSGFRVWRHFQTPGPVAAPNAAVVISAPSDAPSATPAIVATPTPEPTLPPSVFIKVPYTSQFPNPAQAQGGDPHENYCEAAALLMLGDFFRGDTRDRIPPAEADAGMGQIVTVERRTFPGVLDLPLTSVGAIGAQLYGLRPTVSAVDLHQIQLNLAAGRPVLIPVMTHGAPGGVRIAPTYGRVSVYHVILITGYDAAKNLLYTNDAGISLGHNWAYTWETLSSAIDAQAREFPQGRVMLTFDRA